MPTIRKKLIEVALPLEAINIASAREKSIRHGHPSTLHLWWARRPLAAARAVIFAQMVDDPSSVPEEFPTEDAQEAERQRLFKLIEELVRWENTTNDTVLDAARVEIRRSWARWCNESGEDPNKLPPFHDPFAGGGALPLEAQRLGLEAHASDLNPVAVTINKAMIEIPPRFAGRPPVSLVSLGARASRPHTGWHSRGYLPHFDQEGLVQMVTLRLHDSLPRTKLDEIRAAIKSDEDVRERDAAFRETIEFYLDSGAGECLLKSDGIASMVQNALLHFDGERYRLLNWVIMPNHIHVLLEPMKGNRLEDIIHSWKSFTAHEANKILNRSGQFWQEEYFDRYIRDDKHFNAAMEYIYNNPVKAGLVPRVEEWKYCGAFRCSSRENAGGTPALPGIQDWSGARGLAEDVRYYGVWMREEAQKRIGHLYPQATLPDGRKATVIAWLWARTVESPNPAFRGCHVPLVSSFWLSTKKGKEAWVEPVVDGKTYRFEVRTGAFKNKAAIDAGTKLGRGANFRCVLSNSPISPDYIKAEGMAGRMGARLMSVVAEGDRGRVYLSPTDEHETVAHQAQPIWRPDQPLPDDPRNFWTVSYGLNTYEKLFTPRQLVALTTLSDLVAETREKAKADAIRAGLPDGLTHLRDGGLGALAYAEAVSVYLAFLVTQLANHSSSVCGWNAPNGQMRSTFGRQSIPMVWDYAEVNPFSESSGSLHNLQERQIKAFETLGLASFIGDSIQLDAASGKGITGGFVFSTDPPYYDNIGYADLSDFFYVWLRPLLNSVYPDIYSTLLVPKAEELVATPYRHGSKEKAERFFLSGMSNAVHNMAITAHPAMPVTIYYAFKQSEHDSDGTASTGWETFLGAVLQAGFALTGTWPMRTEKAGRIIGIDTNALASSIVLVCRPRSIDAAVTTRRDFLTALKREMPEALRRLQQSYIAPVDLAQASIGPGMAIFTRYAKIIETDGTAMHVRTALALINQTLDEVLAEQEGDFDADTGWAVAWFDQFGFNDGPFGEAETLCKAKNTAVSGLVDAGIATAKAGKVRLLRVDELLEDWDPATDKSLTVWETTHYLMRALNTSEEDAADLAKRLGGQADVARELAYRLYNVCERRKRAQEAQAYNSLVQSWPEIIRLAQRETTFEKLTQSNPDTARLSQKKRTAKAPKLNMPERE